MPADGHLGRRRGVAPEERQERALALNPGGRIIPAGIDVIAEGPERGRIDAPVVRSHGLEELVQGGRRGLPGERNAQSQGREDQEGDEGFHELGCFHGCAFLQEGSTQGLR